MKTEKCQECGRRPLPHSFFERGTTEVARDLLGREICRVVRTRDRTVLLRARIVETEAYLQDGDPAAHCSRGPTPRAKVMFGEPGIIYVYFIYGNYYMLNFVTEKVGKAGAVLIRAVEPIEGIPMMARNRKLAAKAGKRDRIVDLTRRELRHLTSGPAKLTLALGIDSSLNGKPLGFPYLTVCEGEPLSTKAIVTTTRIGISVGKELPLRFYQKESDFVSRG